MKEKEKRQDQTPSRIQCQHAVQEIKGRRRHPKEGRGKMLSYLGVQ